MYLLLVVSLLSCNSHRVFYVYEDSQTNTYAVLELSEKRQEVYYKAVSNKYNNTFTFVKGLKSLIQDDYIGINNFLSSSIIDKDLELETCVDFKGEKTLLYEQQENKIILIENERIKCLENLDLDWFPPFMVKVDKIDYSHFHKDIQKIAKKINTTSAQEIDKILDQSKKIK